MEAIVRYAIFTKINTMSDIKWDDKTVCNYLQFVQTGIDYRVKDVTTFEKSLRDFKARKNPSRWELLEYDVNINTSKALKSFRVETVRRISDGQIFRTGDLISLPYEICGCKMGYIGCITYYLETDLCEVTFKLPLQNTVYYFADLYDAKLAKSILTTEDGVEVYENDKPWQVHTGLLKLNGTADLVKNAKYHPSKDHKYFSTKEAALTYIRDNQKQFSLNDVRKALREGQSYQYHETTVNNLIKIAEGTYEQN